LREAMNAKTGHALLSELSGVDDIRVTFAGVGDPLCHENLFDLLGSAREQGIAAICVETDLLGDATAVKRLAQSGIDVVAVNLPAITPAMYATMMGIDGYERVIENLRIFIAARGLAATPILVPVFMKCRENLGEMEAWYDHWLRALGNAVIDGPSDYAGQIADSAAADMTPPKRRACARLSSRISVLSDGTIVACEQDMMAKSRLGTIGEITVPVPVISDEITGTGTIISIASVWNGKMKLLRSDHQCGQWERHSLCANCREWHRP
jgi:MoaA/NifB/PqqE/SkfB family radical SAM enzyme